MAGMPVPAPRFGWIALAMAALALVSSCGLSTHGVPGAGGGATTCAGDSDCDDKNPCTDDACTSTGVCKHTARGDGLTDDQKAGDCVVTRCRDGELITDPDDDDVGSDGND